MTVKETLMAIKAKKRLVKRKKNVKKPIRRQFLKNLCDLSKPPPSFFRIIPSHTFPSTVINAIQIIKDDICSIEEYKIQIRKIPFSKSFQRPSMACVMAHRKRLTPILAAIHTVMKHRFALRRFLHRWRASRVKIMNTEDIVTLDPIRNPVYITDTIQRQAFSFEANTLQKDITARLLTHDGFFSDPQLPRNPYTNKPLTLAQQISVWQQLSSCGINVSSAFTAFRSVSWNMKRFEIEYDTILQLHSTRNTLADIRSEDSRERLFDFIRHVHHIEGDEYNGEIYSIMINEFPTNNYIVSWRNLCIKYDVGDIIYANNTVKRLSNQDDILEDACDLINDKRMMWTFKFLKNNKGETIIPTA